MEHDAFEKINPDPTFTKAKLKTRPGGRIRTAPTASISFIDFFGSRSGPWTR